MALKFESTNVAVFPDFLSRDECGDFVRVVDSPPAEPAQVVRADESFLDERPLLFGSSYSRALQDGSRPAHAAVFLRVSRCVRNGRRLFLWALLHNLSRRQLFQSASKRGGPQERPSASRGAPMVAAALPQKL